MGFSLLAFDTDHVKRYVFGTDTLKEIRGASSLLDYLNRVVMLQLAQDYQAECVYAHGGSGLFLVEAAHAEAFGKRVQQAYRDMTGGGASVTYAASQPLPDHIQKVGPEKIEEILELLQWRLQEEKLRPPTSLALATHPFLRLCDSCGLEYAADLSRELQDELRDPNEKDERYCESCQRKRVQDWKVKKFIGKIVADQDKKVKDSTGEIVADRSGSPPEYLWDHIIPRLDVLKYDIPPETDRPKDFNVFREFKGAKDYLGLIYADANNMGRHIGDTPSLLERQEMARKVDEALYTAVCTAIHRHLKIADHIKPREQQQSKLNHPVFPFDILLLGGDDICMVVPASVAMDVALTLAETFRQETQEKHTLSLSVVLAPVKYPFGLLYDMAETALKFAKQASADARSVQNGAAIDDTRINYLLVTGSNSSNFKTVYESTYHAENETERQEFYATLRPYAPADLRRLLKAMHSKDAASLGRTRLHQMREAIFEMNLTTAVSESLALLRNWRKEQRNHIMRTVYAFATHHQLQQSDPADPAGQFPRVIFPWFQDGKNKKRGYQIYRTSLLDFIELYDFISREGEATREED